MEEWKTYKLGSLCKKVCSGGTPKSTCDKYYGGGIPWLNTKEVDFNRIYSTESTISQVGLENSSAKWIDENSVIVAMYGNTAGKVALAKIPLTTNQACCNLMLDQNKADYRFIFYYLSSQYLTIKAMANGAAQQNLNAQQIKDIEVPLPSLRVQHQIADVLSSIDDKIELNNRINHNLEEQAQAIFDEWCMTCKEYVPIAEISRNILDYTPYQRDRVVPLNSSDVTKGIFADVPYAKVAEIKGQFKKRFKKGDILYSEIRPRNLHYAFCYFDPTNFLASTRLMVIRANSQKISSPVLLYQYLMMPKVLEEFTTKTESRSGTFPQGNYKDLSSSEVPFSENNRNISMQLESMYTVIWKNFEENKHLSSLRNGILPQLMSGNLKINEIDC